MNIDDGRQATLFGRSFVLNISLDENLPGGLTAVQRDPRKLRLIPAAFVGVVEEVGPGCELVRPGERVVVERWSWGQFDLDSERLIANESHLLVLANNTPAPRVVVFKLIFPPVPTELLALPGYEPPKLPSHCGEVLASACGDMKVGERYWFQKSDVGQFLYGDGRLAFRNSGYAEVLMRGEKVEEKGEVHVS